METRPFDWTDFLGQHRTIAIHTPILVWTGDYHAAALFEELVWRWNMNGREPFKASDAELMAKLYMTRGALRGARARLVELGAVSTVAKGAPPTLHYTTNPYAMAESVDSIGESNQSIVRIQPIDRPELANRSSGISQSSIYPESLQNERQGASVLNGSTDGEPASQASPPFAPANGAHRANGVAPSPFPPVENPPLANIAADAPALPAVNGTARRSARNGTGKAEKPAPDPQRAASLKAVFGELCVWLGLDWQHLPDNARGRLNKTAGNVVDAGLTAETVARARRDWTGDWRGKQGQKPELGQVEMLIAKAGAIPATVDMDAMW